MKRSLLPLLVPVFLAFLAPLCAAALKVGSPAPALSPASWLQGAEVPEFGGDKVYLVEFWATWCGPCIAVIPHLDGLHRKHKDKGLVVIGQNVMEDDVAKVRDFVRNMGARMSYRVAFDGAQGKMAASWLKAAGQNGIPCAFVVDKKGRIAYIGHPLRLEESLLVRLLDEPSTKPAAAKPADDGPDPAALALAGEAAGMIRSGRHTEAARSLARLHDVLGENSRHIGALLELDLLIARDEHGDAVELGRMLAEDFAGDPAVLADLAARLVAPDAASPAMLALAGEIAKPLADGGGDAREPALAVLARVKSLRGDDENSTRPPAADPSGEE